MLLKHVVSIPVDVCRSLAFGITLFLLINAAPAMGAGLPAGASWIHTDAELGPPNTPFVVPTDGLHTAGSFESTRAFHIDALATITTQADTTLHLSGDVSNVGSSVQGLAK